MKNKVLSITIGTLLLFTACGANNEATLDESATPVAPPQMTEEVTEESGIEVSNSLFTITLPAECKDTFNAETTDEQITICHKESAEAGYGGMAFTIWAREMPSEYAGGPYVKKGELTTADGKKYEVVLGYPTEVQWDFTVSEEAPAEYDALYNSAEDVVKTLKGVDGATFEYGAGTAGASIYGDVVAKYKTAFEEGWDASTYEENDMSPEIYSLTENGGLANIGIAYYDVNLDGIDELFVGSLDENELKGTIYDIYTTVDGVPAHVVSGSARDRYYIYGGSLIVNEYSSGADESGKNVYDLTVNSTELLLQWATKYDAYENADQPWFIGYYGEEWENVSEEDYNQREASEDNYVELDFTPLSEAE